MMDRRGGRGGQKCAAGTVCKQDEQEGEELRRGGQMNVAGTVWRQDEQEGENGRG